MSRIFISYRRSLSHYSIQVLTQWLTDHFGSRSYFLDTAVIEHGDSFPDRIRNAIDQCSVFLPLFGRGWDTLTDSNGVPRVKKGGDWVREELSIALQRRVQSLAGNSRPILIIPLVELDAEQPSLENLPEDLASLAEIDSLRFESFESLNSLLALIDKQFGGVPMGKFAARVLGQAPDLSCKAKYRFRYANNEHDLQAFVKLSDAEATIMGAHPDLSGDERLTLYKKWAQWSAPDRTRSWSEGENTGKAFLLLEQRRDNGDWWVVGVSIMLSLTLSGVRQLLQSDLDTAYEEVSAISLDYSSITCSSRRLLLDTWIIRQKDAAVTAKTPRVDHEGWGRTLQLRHIAELLGFEQLEPFSLFCEPDNKLIERLLQDLGFQERKRNTCSSKLYAIRVPLNEEDYDEETISRIDALYRGLQTLRKIDIS